MKTNKALQNQIYLLKKYKASELLPILQKTNAYGYERFKKLCTWA